LTSFPETGGRPGSIAAALVVVEHSTGEKASPDSRGSWPFEQRRGAASRGAAAAASRTAVRARRESFILKSVAAVGLEPTRA
jgi:hypothetical protein